MRKFTIFFMLSGLTTATQIARAQTATAEKHPNADQKPPEPSKAAITQVDAQFRVLTQDVAGLANCFSRYSKERASLAAKTQELETQYGGGVPRAYDDFFHLKSSRMARLKTQCFALNNAVKAEIPGVDAAVRGLEPHDSLANRERRKRMNAVVKKVSGLISGLR